MTALKTEKGREKICSDHAIIIHRGAGNFSQTSRKQNLFWTWTELQFTESAVPHVVRFAVLGDFSHLTCSLGKFPSKIASEEEPGGYRVLFLTFLIQRHYVGECRDLCCEETKEARTENVRLLKLIFLHTLSLCLID